MTFAEFKVNGNFLKNDYKMDEIFEKDDLTTRGSPRKNRQYMECGNEAMKTAFKDFADEINPTRSTHIISNYVKNEAIIREMNNFDFEYINID